MTILAFRNFTRRSTNKSRPSALVAAPAANICQSVLAHCTECNLQQNIFTMSMEQKKGLGTNGVSTVEWNSVFVGHKWVKRGLHLVDHVRHQSQVQKPILRRHDQTSASRSIIAFGRKRLSSRRDSLRQKDCKAFPMNVHPGTPIWCVYDRVR